VKNPKKTPTMKKLSYFHAGLLSLSLIQAEMRTWTSAADATKSFEGQMVSLSGQTITIKKTDGSTISAELSKFSQADIDFAMAQPPADPATHHLLLLKRTKLRALTPISEN
jgi:hypothetical protein